MSGLTMREFLLAHLIFDKTVWNTAAEALVAVGYNEKIVMRKAERAARKDYLEYGVNPWYGWITEKGKEFLE